ncbi:helix-turn-helix domain-containing protein [Nocardia sp. NPDC005825]|uniref:TetR/AcrR family transcriptional regulator n=1 Tax=unclassified Nocardia TaxID=2637762 RepID=UPI0033D1912C
MPKIRAATVAEHHATQRRALLDAAREVLAAGQVPTLTEIANRTGLARPSVYQYFSSRDDLLIAVMEDAFPRWSARIGEQMGRVANPADQVLEYITANIDLVVEGEHAVARALAAALPNNDMAGRARQLHDGLTTPLTAALAELGAPDPELTAELINAVVHAATRLVEAGHDAAAVEARSRELVAPYLAALTG